MCRADERDDELDRRELRVQHQRSLGERDAIVRERHPLVVQRDAPPPTEEREARPPLQPSLASHAEADAPRKALP